MGLRFDLFFASSIFPCMSDYSSLVKVLFAVLFIQYKLVARILMHEAI